MYDLQMFNSMMSQHKSSTELQARSQVLRFGGEKKILGGQEFYFQYMFITHFSRHKTLRVDVSTQIQ